MTNFKRIYEDACAAAHGLDLIGERWTLLVMRELMFGPKRFSDLRNNLPSLSANVLTQRLERLEQVGIVQKRKLAPPASVNVYELTQWGYDCEPVLQSLGRWAVRSPFHDPLLPISTNSFLLSLKTMIATDKVRDMKATIRLKLGEETFRAELRDSRLNINCDEPALYDFSLEGKAEVLSGAIYGGVPLTQLESSKQLVIDGDRSMAESFVSLFPLPAKADT